MYAVFDRKAGHVTFVGRIPPGFRGRWQEGVTLAPTRAPDAGHGGAHWIVGVSLADRTHYRLFERATDLQGSGFRSTGLLYGGEFEDVPDDSVARQTAEDGG